MSRANLFIYSSALAISQSPLLPTWLTPSCKCGSTIGRRGTLMRVPPFHRCTCPLSVGPFYWLRTDTIYSLLTRPYCRCAHPWPYTALPNHAALAGVRPVIRDQVSGHPLPASQRWSDRSSPEDVGSALTPGSLKTENFKRSTSRHGEKSPRNFRRLTGSHVIPLIRERGGT